ELEPAEQTKNARLAARRGHPGDFVKHMVPPFAGKGGLQAVGANIWCAVLAGCLRNAVVAEVARKRFHVAPVCGAGPVPEVLLSRLRAKPEIIPVGWISRP